MDDHAMIRRLWENVQRLRGAESVLDFVPRLSPRWERPEHLRRFADAFARVDRSPVRLLISVPRRHGKTELILHAIARWLLLNPHKSAAYVSYSSDFSEDKSKRLRDLALKAGVQIRKDSNKAALWHTVQGGGLHAPGIGGPLTGHGVDLLVVDDPHKNREEAESSTMRSAVHEWFTSTGISSVEPGGSVIVCHTRWHQDDLIGTLDQEDASLVASGKRRSWEYINLPAISDAGEALWPSRWPLSELTVRRREVGEYDWASLFMGQPRPKGGALFHEPARYNSKALEDNAYWNGKRIFIGVDPAATEKTSADYSAIVVGAASVRPDRLMQMDVLDVRCLQVSIPQLARELRGVQHAWKAPIAVESQGGFKGVAQMLRDVDRGLRVYEVTAKSNELAPEVRGDKFTRAQPVAAAWNDGRVRVPLDSEWVQSFVTEITRFTGIKDKHDDQVDALAYLWNFAHRMMFGRQRATTNDAPGLTWG